MSFRIDPEKKSDIQMKLHSNTPFPVTSSKQESLFFNNGIAAIGLDDGRIQLYRIAPSCSFQTSKPIADLSAIRKNYEANFGCRSLDADPAESLYYCIDGFRFSGILSKNILFLLADLQCPKMTAINLDPAHFGETHDISSKNISSITCVAALPNGRLAVGTSSGRVFLSDSPYQFGSSPRFCDVANFHSSIMSIAANSHYLVYSSIRELGVLDLATKRSLKTLPKREACTKIQNASQEQFVFGDHHGLNILNVKSWEMTPSKDHILDFAVGGGYIAATVLKVFQKAVAPIKTNQCLVAIKIWDAKTGAELFEKNLAGPRDGWLEENHSISWTPTGNLIVYEKATKIAQHINLSGLKFEKTPPAKKIGVFAALSNGTQQTTMTPRFNT